MSLCLYVPVSLCSFVIMSLKIGSRDLRVNPRRTPSKTKFQGQRFRFWWALSNATLRFKIGTMVRKLFFSKKLAKWKIGPDPWKLPQQKLFLAHFLAMNVSFIQYPNFENPTTDCKVIIIKLRGRITDDRWQTTNAKRIFGILSIFCCLLSLIAHLQPTPAYVRPEKFTKNNVFYPGLS